MTAERSHMKIVVLDGHTKNPGDLSWSRFEQLGELTVYERSPGADTKETIRRIDGAQAVLVSETSLNREVFESCPSIRYVGTLSTGYNTVDLEAAWEKQITVCNIPTYGTNSVAQFAIALLLEICNQVGHHSEAVKQGRWGEQPDFCFWDTPLIELAGKTLGVIGFGRIGRQTARIAQALGMKILYYDALAGRGMEGEDCLYAPLDELFGRSDVITLHCPLTSDTEQMINRDTIEQMKDGVILLNVARGGLVDDEALAEAIHRKKVYAAGLDVVSKEPIPSNHPLLTEENCIITPHIAWAAKESRARLLTIAADNLEAYAKGAAVNVVRP